MHLNLLIADHDPAVFSLARAALLRSVLTALSGQSVAHWLIACPPDWDTRSLTAGAVLSCPSQNPRRPPRAVPVSTTRRAPATRLLYRGSLFRF